MSNQALSGSKKTPPKTGGSEEAMTVSVKTKTAASARRTASSSKKEMYGGVKEMLFLMEYLITNSSPGHKLTEAELRMALYRFKNPTGSLSGTVYNNAINQGGIPERVTRFIELFSNKKVFSFLNFKAAESNAKGHQLYAKKYYTEGPLSERTVCILRDAIAVYPYAEQAVTKEIIKELNRLTNKFNRREYNLPEVDALKFPGTYYENLMEIYSALSTAKKDANDEKLTTSDCRKDYSEYEREIKNSKGVSKLRFEYCQYNYDGKRFVLETRAAKYNDEEHLVREVNPLMLIWSNGYYYLVTYACIDGKYRYYNYRVDRMRNVECLDGRIEKKDGSHSSKRENKPADTYDDKTYFRYGEFDPKLYVTKHPVMYSSSKMYGEVKIKCSRYILNNALDTFGFNIVVTDHDKDTVTFKTTNLTSKGVLMWALEYCEDCEILSPVELREEMNRYSGIIKKKYGNASE